VQSNATKSATLPLPAARPLAVHSRNGPPVVKRAEFRRAEALAHFHTHILASPLTPPLRLHCSPAVLAILASLTYSTAVSILQIPVSTFRHPTAVPLSTPGLLQHNKVDDNNDYLFWRLKPSGLYFHPNVEIVILS